MGLFTRFRKTTPQEAVAWGGDYWGSNPWQLSDHEYQRIVGMTPAELWRTQPYLRTVVSFLARNIAQLGLHAYQRVSDVDRVRVHDQIGEAVRRPNAVTTSYELIYGLVADLALYDRAYLLLSEDPDQLWTRLPVPWVTPYGGDALGPEGYRVRANAKGEIVRIPADQVLPFHGWAPDALNAGSTPVSALREILAEQVQAARYREAVWKRGGKVGAVLSRPADAPEWGEDARRQFKLDWDAQFSGSGPRVGGTPLLEDGMSLSRVDFNAHEMQFIEGARLALNTVASVYHINPTMIGLLDNANYSNVREFRRMLYGDTLGPTIAQIESRLNAFLVPKYDSRPGIYLEFNIEEKLQGNFEEQTVALQAAVGRPWMTTNEARALRNLPALDEGEGLVTPLNVLVGGLASPVDTAPEATPSAAASNVGGVQTRRGNLYLLKARTVDRQVEQLTAVLRRFFARQASADRYHQGRGEWDVERWNRELAVDLHAVFLEISAVLGRDEMQALGFDPDVYNTDQTIRFLQVAAERRARNINFTTKRQIDEELGDPDGNPALVYTNAQETRAPGVAAGLGTFLAGWATHEAAEQLAYTQQVEPTKTWLTGPNARASHAQINGETVPLDGTFSNGLRWPGDDNSSDPDQVAGCNCSLQINLA